MRAYLQTSGSVFGVIAVAHLLRLLWHWPIDLVGQLVPLWRRGLAYSCQEHSAFGRCT